MKKFKVGDRVVVTKVTYGDGYMEVGEEGVVRTVVPDGAFVALGKDAGTNDDPEWDEWFFGYDVEDGEIELFKRAPKPRKSIAKDLKLTPQAKTVLRHLERKKRISPAEALVVHGISRLASCVHEIRKAGYNVDTTVKRDEHGHKYARYKMVKEAA